MVLERYRLGQGPRLSANQHERVALLTSIAASLGRAGAPGESGAAGETSGAERAWAWVNQPREIDPFGGDSPLYFMLEKGLPGLRAVARLLVREKVLPSGTLSG